jgi:tRNA(Arg) A34 adenosine deaminase TadA
MNLDVLINQAKEKALESNCRVPMVCFLMRSAKIVAYGVNKKGFRGASIHAEIDCLRKVRFQKRRGKNTTLIVMRFKRDGNLGKAKPCANCLAIIDGMGIKTIGWTTGRQTLEFGRTQDVENDYVTRRCGYGCEVITGLENFKKQGD